MYRTRIYQETLIDAASSKIDCFFWDKSVNVQLTLVSDHPHHATTRKCSLLLVVYKRNLEKLAPGFLRLATPTTLVLRRLLRALNCARTCWSTTGPTPRRAAVILRNGVSYTV